MIGHGRPSSLASRIRAPACCSSACSRRFRHALSRRTACSSSRRGCELPGAVRKRGAGRGGLPSKAARSPTCDCWAWTPMRPARFGSRTASFAWRRFVPTSSMASTSRSLRREGAQLTVELSPDNAAPAKIDVPLAESDAAAVSKSLDNHGSELLVHRSPNDSLRIETDRDTLIFEPGERFTFTVRPVLEELLPTTTIDVADDAFAGARRRHVCGTTSSDRRCRRTASRT